MTSFLIALEKEIDTLKKMKDTVENDLTVPEKASIVAVQIGQSTYYYKCDNGRRSYLGKYGSVKLDECVKAAYKHAAIETLNHDLSLLSTIRDQFIPYDAEHIMNRLSPCVRNLRFDHAESLIMPELFQWARQPYEKNPASFGDTVILAKDGTRVRSRAECIIYNALFDAGLPFRYDPMLHFVCMNELGELEKVGKAPDFQIICPDRSFILIEHGGLLKSSQYAIDLAKKIRLYLTNGYTLGYSLFVTSDNVDGGIDSKEICKMIDIIKARFPFL